MACLRLASVVTPGASSCAESGLECAFVKGASRADHESRPLTLRPESLPRLPPPRDAGASAVLAGRDGRGPGPSRGFGELPERGRICLRTLYLGSSPSAVSSSWSVSPGTVPSGRNRHLRIQAQGCCPRVSRCQPRSTELGSRVRKKPELT